MKCFPSVVVAIVVAVLVLPGAAVSQCPANDGFGFPLGCCTPAMPNLPNFPTMTLNGLGACIKDCGVESQFTTVTTIAPTQVLCDYWIMALSITAPTFTVGTPLLVAKYDRTWVEFPVLGAVPIQVWRFLVNGDLVYSPGAAAGFGCPIPLSVAPPLSLPVHYVGNVDYAFNCATGGWEIAYTLTHFCPTEMHAPFSARPIAAAAGWLKRTYHFVGPANFVFGLCPPPDGPIVADSTRTSVGLTLPVPYTCLHETQVVQGLLQNISQNCVCFDPAPLGPPPRYMHQNLNALEICVGAAAPISSFGFFGISFLPTGLRALMLGSYIVPAGSVSYPGNECISVYLGILDSPGLCPPAVPPPALHAVTGIGTTGGYPVQLFDWPAPPSVLDFLDLQNMLVFTAAGFIPGLGALFGSERIWSFNML